MAVSGKRWTGAPVLVALLLASTTAISITSADDGDGDGIDDVVDDCPFAAGNSTIGNIGCPDSDGDGDTDLSEGVTGDWNGSRRTLYVNHGDSRAVAWAPDSIHLAGAGDGRIMIYAPNGRTLSTLHEITENVRALAFSPNGSHLAVGGYFDDDAGHAWALVLQMDWSNLSATVLYNLSSNHTGNVFDVEWSPDGNYVYTACNDQAVRQFHSSNGSLNQTFTFLDPVYGIDVSPDGRLIGSVHGQDTSINWTSNGTMYLDRHDHSGTTLAVAFSPDGRVMATGSDDNRISFYDVANATALSTGNSDGWRDVKDISFDPSGAFLAIGNGGDSAHIRRVDNFSLVNDFGSFGYNQNTRGVRAIDWSPDGTKIALGQSRGRTTVHTLQEGFATLKGDFIGERLEPNWFTHRPLDPRLTQHDNMTGAAVPYELCSNNGTIGIMVRGVPQHIATPRSNHSTSGLLDCPAGYSGEILEVPIGRMAATLIVQENGDAQACISAIGGISMAQLRWILSSYSDNNLAQTTWAPGLNIASIAPDDDDDGIKEWSDLDSSCVEEGVHISNTWDNRSLSTMTQRLLLCGDCETPEASFSTSGLRYHIKEEFEDGIPEAVAISPNSAILAFSEMRESLGQAGVWHVPVIDNWTHGAAAALAAGGSAITPSIATSEDGTWPVQQDVVLAIEASDLSEQFAVINWMLSDEAQAVWDAAGLVHLGPMDRVWAWARIGVDAIDTLPDIDGDGKWDGIDDCDGPTSDWDAFDTSLDRDQDGCHDATEDDDDDADGISDLEDDCDDIDDLMGWVSDSTNDHDSDGCRDIDEDNDDDDDGIPDGPNDRCHPGWSNWTSSSLTDHDADGCADDGEDGDDDDDGVSDETDACPRGEVGWSSTPSLDRDGDGCSDGLEDDDDDGDGVLDENDDCDDALGALGWVSNSSNDHDSDGCRDSDEDSDDDSDGVPDSPSDACPLGWRNWTSDSTTDHDGDGCADDGEDADDDDDLLPDDDDDCPRGTLGWTRDTTTDHDGDGCEDAGEDQDDDDDGFSESNGDDRCPGTTLGAFVDAFGCAEDQGDSDGDGIENVDDLCQEENATGWDSDLDGCIDDSDEDSVKDDTDSCVGDTFGLEVNDAGCTALQIDVDGDGVVGDPHENGTDICPETLEGEAVNGSGCSIDQRRARIDTDGDGVMDLDDACSDTPDDDPSTALDEGEIDEAGCSYTQQDADEDGIANIIDECPGTPPLHQVDAVGCSASQLGIGEGMSSGVILTGIAGIGILIVGGAVAVILLRGKGRTPSPKSKRRRSTDGQSVERSDGTSQATLLEEGGEATTAGMADDEGGSADDGITVDEHGTEWWQDDAGAWWYRTPEMNDWAIHDS